MAPRSLALLFVSLAATTLAHADAASPAQKLTAKFPAEHVNYYALTYDSETDVVGDVRVNDVPLATFTGKGNSGSSADLPRWLTPGTNHLDIILTKIPGPDSPRMRDEIVTVAVHGLAQRGMPDDSNAIVKITLRKADMKVGAFRFVFDVPEKQAPAGTLWKRAAVLTTVADEDKLAIGLLCTKMLDAIKRGDATAAKKLMQVVFEEGSRTAGMSPAEIGATFEEYLPQMKKTFGAARLQPESLDYRIVFGGRAVFVMKKDGSPPVVVQGKEGWTSSMTFHAAKLDGTWVLIP